MSTEPARPSTPVANPPVHVVEVYDDGESDLTHPGCETVEVMEGVQDYDCLLGRIVRYEGWDEQFDQPPAPGRYTVTAWAFQSTDHRTFGEWVSGVDLKPLPDAPLSTPSAPSSEVEP